MRNAATVLGLLASIAGCAGFSDVVQERTQVQLAGQPPTVELACERTALRSEKRLPGEWESVGPIAVEAEPDPDIVQVGWLNAPMQDVPILISGPRPNTVLSRDVATELRRRGFPVTSEAPTADLILHAGVTMLATEWLPGHWYDFTRTLRGHAVVRMALRHGTDVLWSKVFEAHDEARYAYDRSSNHAKLLDEAYCRCLEQFDRALDDPEFETAVRRAEAGT